MNNFTAEDITELKSWASDEASGEADHYVLTVLQNHDSRDNKLVEKLTKDVNYWFKAFEYCEPAIMQFIHVFNSKVPEFCKIETSQVNFINDSIF